MAAKTIGKDIKQVRSLLTAINKKKATMAKHRDQLRDLFSDLENLLVDLDTGIEDVESGLRLIESGLDSISGH